MNKSNNTLLSKGVMIDNVNFINLTQTEINLYNVEGELINIPVASISRSTIIGTTKDNICGLEVYDTTTEKPLGISEYECTNVMYIVTPDMKAKYSSRSDFLAYGKIFKNKDTLQVIETLYR